MREPEGWPNSSAVIRLPFQSRGQLPPFSRRRRSEEHTSELQSPCNLVCRLLLEKKKSLAGLRQRELTLAAPRVSALRPCPVFHPRRTLGARDRATRAASPALEACADRADAARHH